MRHVMYRGFYSDNGCQVTADGGALLLRHDLYNFAPEFAWGYEGSGPSQLALALLADHCVTDEGRALKLYQRFLERVIAMVPQRADWSMDSATVENFLSAIEAEHDG